MRTKRFAAMINAATAAEIAPVAQDDLLVLLGSLRSVRALAPACCGFAHAFLTQTTETALANVRNKVEERLSRWLLMARMAVSLFPA
jgi:hypothetical protein